MGISLTLFLNLNCLMLILFPYGKMFAQKGVNKAESFSKSVCFAFIIFLQNNQLEILYHNLTHIQIDLYYCVFFLLYSNLC